MNAELITGHNNRMRIQLTEADGTDTGDLTGATVTATLESEDRTERLTPVYTLSSGTAGANWSTGRIAVLLPSADLAAALALIAAPQVRLHVLVVLAGVGTDYFAELPLVQGFL